MTTILIIDDDIEVRFFMQTLLEIKGYQVFLAASAREGMQLVEQSPPDIICCDLMMPVMSGVDFIKHVKANPATAHIPVIVITAAGERGLLDEALRQGASATLTKPFGKAQRYGILQQVLNP